MINKRRYTNQQIWDGSNLSLFGSIAAFSLAVSCMFLSVGMISGPSFLLYVPLLPAVLLLVGGVYEKNPVARAVAWGIAWVIVAITGLLVWIGSENSGFLICLGLLVLPTVALVYAVIQARTAYRAAVTASLDQMLLDLVEMRGEITFGEVDEELEIGRDEVRDRAESLYKNKRLTGAVDLASQRIYSLAGLAAKQEQIARVVKARGQMGLGELSEEMKVPADLLRNWIRQLARLGQLFGYVDWEKEVIYSQEREKLAGHENCPNCAADLVLAGQGIVGCEFCGAEIFI